MQQQTCLHLLNVDGVPYSMYGLHILELRDDQITTHVSSVDLLQHIPKGPTYPKKLYVTGKVVLLTMYKQQLKTPGLIHCDLSGGSLRSCSLCGLAFCNWQDAVEIFSELQKPVGLNEFSFNGFKLHPLADCSGCVCMIKWFFNTDELVFPFFVIAFGQSFCHPHRDHMLVPFENSGIVPQETQEQLSQ